MLNQVSIMGRLTRAPELRHTQAGMPVAAFTLAVERDFKDGNGDKQTDFIDIVAWRKTGEFVSKYFTKGQMAAVSGRLQIREWTDREGSKRRSAEVIADHVYFAESKRSRENIQDDSTQGYDSDAQRLSDIPPYENDGELPF